MTDQYVQMLLNYGFKKEDDTFLLECGNQNIYVTLHEDAFEMVVSQEGKTTVTEITNYNNEHDMFLKQYKYIIEHKM